MLAWYFSNETRTLGHGDGRKIEVGTTHEVKFPCGHLHKPILCRAGLHACSRILEVLPYANSTYLYRVKLSGDISKRTGLFAKAVARKREYLWTLDVGDMLKRVAFKAALDVCALLEPPPYVVNYLKTSNPKYYAITNDWLYRKRINYEMADDGCNEKWNKFQFLEATYRAINKHSMSSSAAKNYWTYLLLVLSSTMQNCERNTVHKKYHRYMTYLVNKEARNKGFI
jgi:hypothetical protein